MLLLLPMKDYEGIITSGFAVLFCLFLPTALVRHPGPTLCTCSTSSEHVRTTLTGPDEVPRAS